MQSPLACRADKSKPLQFQGAQIVRCCNLDCVSETPIAKGKGRISGL